MKRQKTRLVFIVLFLFIAQRAVLVFARDSCCFVAADGSARCQNEDIKSAICTQFSECCRQWNDFCAEYAQLLSPLCAVQCGDGICNSQPRNSSSSDTLLENCSSCPRDCGFCEEMRPVLCGTDAASFETAAASLLIAGGKQWYFNNTGAASSGQNHVSSIGEDINVLDVWQQGIFGTNVSIAIIDDGIQWQHSALQCNYDAELSIDIDRNLLDASPLPGDGHGTQCAGVALARDQLSSCGVGTAFRAKLVGIRLLGERYSDSNVARALNHELSKIDIYSNSYGPYDDGRTMESYPLALAALERGAREGRAGKGSIYLWASGNGHPNDESNYDELANSIYSICVSSSDWNGKHASYSETGSNVLINAPSGNIDPSGARYSSLLTTDRIGWPGNNPSGDWYGDFMGTSASAPLVAGVVALMLEARPALTWRDVQHMLVNSATKNDPFDVSWKKNGAGRWFSRKYGFGRVNAARAVDLARNSTKLVCQRFFSLKNETTASLPLTIPTDANRPLIVSFNFDRIITVEHVVVRITAEHRRRGSLSFSVQSPSGTVSLLVAGRPQDMYADLDNVPFSSVEFWGEPSVVKRSSSAGHRKWYFAIYDKNANDGISGTLLNVELTLYGTTSDCSDEPERVEFSEEEQDDDPLEPSDSPLPPPISPAIPINIKTLIMCRSFRCTYVIRVLLMRR